MKLGIFGGSFNPIHIGHMIIADDFFEQIGLDKVIFVPTFISPFKVNSEKQIPDNLRLSMLRDAISHDPRFEVDDFEISKGDISFTYDTVIHIKGKFQTSNIFMLVGQDNLKDLKKWYKFEELNKMVTFCVAGRITNSNIENPPNQHYIKIDSPLIDISSTDIRARIKQKKSFRYMLLTQTYNTIISNNLYK